MGYTQTAGKQHAQAERKGNYIRGYLKAACVIQQCTRCFALRDLTQEAGECRSCRALLNVSHTETRSLSFGDVTSDEPLQPAAYLMGGMSQGAA